jgi:hypothetical protein
MAVTWPSTYTASPTLVGFKKEMESMVAVRRKPPRATRRAAMCAHCSIQRMIWPPNVMPMELACWVCGWVGGGAE